MRWTRWAAGSLAALVVVTAAGWPVYVRPEVATPTPRDPADAIVVLGGLPETAFYGRKLFEDGDARHLVLSSVYGVPPWSAISELCPAEPGSGVTCFVPRPATTRGEAQEIRRLAVRNHWDDVIVVAPTFHVSRARMIVRRCYGGRLRMVEYRPARYWRWPYQYLYQTVGYAKAAVLRGC